MRKSDNSNKIKRFQEYEKLKLSKLSDAEKYHLKVASEIDKQIIEVQRSTKVNIPQLSWLHNYLRSKFSWYRLWHMNKWSNLTHYIILAVYISTISFTTSLGSVAGWQLSDILKPLGIARAASINISGTCKQNNNSTNCSDSTTIKVAVNGSLAGQTGSTSSGSWSITGVTVSDNDVLTLFSDGVADDYEAAAVVKLSTAGNVTGVQLISRHLTIGASTNQTVSNADIGQYDSSVSSDEDIFFEVDSNNDLKLPATSTSTFSDQKLYILASNTYRPDSSSSGNVISPNLEIPTSATFTADANTIELTAGGTPFTRTGTFNYDTSTFKYSSGSATTVTAANYYSLDLKPSSGGSGSGGYTVSGAGTTAYNGTYTESGTNNGKPKYTDGTRWLFNDYAEMPASNVWCLYTSVFDVGMPMSCAYFSFSADLPGTWSVGGGTTPAPSLSASATSTEYTFSSGTFNIYGNFTAGDGTNGVTANADTNDPTVNVDGDFSISANGGGFTASASGSLTIAGNYSNSGTFADSGGTITFDKSSGTQTINAGGTGTTQDFQNVTKSQGGIAQLITNNIKINGTLTINSSNTFDINGKNITLATLSNSGTFKLQGGETATITTMDTDSGIVEYTGTTTYSALAAGNNYYDLVINGSGGSFSPSGTVTIANDLTITAGTLAGTQSINVNGGDASGNGTINLTGGTFSLDGNGNFGGTTNWTFYNLTFGDGTGTATSFKTSTNQITTSNVLTIAANQTLNAGDDTWILSGSGTPFVNNGIFTYSTSTIKYTGAGDTTIAAATYYNLETSPSAAGSGGWSVSGAGTTEYNGSYTESGTNNGKPKYTDGTRWLFNDYAETPAANYWCLYTSVIDINMPGMQCSYFSSSADLPGSWSYGTGGTAPAPTLSANAAAAEYTFASGTINIFGNYTNGDGTNEVSVTSDTNDPTIDISGNFTNSADATFIASNSGTFNIAGNLTLNSSSVLTHSSGTVTLDGSGAQTVTMNGTGTGHQLNNLTITNASASGVSLADSLTLAGTFTATTASSKITFNSGSTYAFNAISINGQSTSTRVTLTSSSSGSAWNLNITASSPTASNVSVKDSNANKDIDATTGGEDLTGNTHWLFPSSGSGIDVSGNIYTAENKSTNIGASKTVAISVNGGTKSTVETTSGGAFSFSSVSVSTNNTISIYLDDETEKASFVTQAANDTSDITSLELFTSHIILSHQTAGPMTNTLLATADNVSDTDLLISVDGSSNATFTADNEVWILGGKSYTPGANVTAAGLDILSTATFSPEANTLTLTGAGTPFAVSGTFNESTSTVIYTGSSATNVAGTTYNNLTLNQSGTTFTSTGATTVKSVLTITAGTFDADDETITLTGTGTPFVVTDTFDSGTSTIKYTGAGDTTVATATYYNLETKPIEEGAGDGSSYVVTGAGDSNYNGTYEADGTYNGQTAYTNGSLWLFYSYNLLYESYRWFLYPSKADLHATPSLDAYWDGSSLPGSWSAGADMGAAPTVSASTSPYTYTLASGTINISGNYTNGDGTNGVILNADTNDPTLNIDGNFVNSAGATFIASATGTLSVASNFTNNSTATLTHSSGTITFDGQGTQTITTNGDALFNTVLNNTGASGSFAIASALDINGTFTLTDGTLDLDTSDPTLNIAGNITINGGSVTKSSTGSLVTFDGDLTYDDNVGAVNFGDIQIGASPDTTNLSSDFTCDSLTIASGDYFYTNGYDIDSAGDITINSTGTLDATDDGELDGTTINLAGSWSNSGTFTADTSEVIFDATATGETLSGTLTGSSAFNDLTFNGSGGEWTLGGNLAASDITVANGILNQGTGNTITASSITQRGGTFTGSNGNITVSGSVTLSGGSFTSTSGTIYVSGNWNDIGSTFVHNSGTIDFNNTSSVTFSTLGISTYNNIGHSGSGTLTFSNWGSNYKELTIDNSVVSTEDQTNFPLLVYIASDSDLAADAQDDGDDIMFTLADGQTKLSHEIERFNPSTGELWAWVKIPTLSASADTVINLFYGNSTVSSQQDVANVWDENYVGVWHLNETSGQHLDSTANNNDSTSMSVSAQGTAGKIGGSDNFNGINNYISIPDSDSLDLAGNYTLQAWINRDVDSGTWERIMSKSTNGTGASYDYWMQITAGTYPDKIGGGIINTLDAPQYQFDTLNSGTSISLDTWHSLAVGLDGTTLRGYLNGAVNKTATIEGTPRVSTKTFEIGRLGGSGTWSYKFDGLIDEVRVSSAKRADSWLATEYNNQSNPANYQTIDTESTINISLSGSLENSAGTTNTNGVSISVANDLIVSAGSLVAGTSSISVSGDVNFTGGAFDKGTSTVVLNGTGSLQTQTVTSASQQFYNFTSQNDSTNGTILVDALYVANNLYVAATGSSDALLDASTNNVNVTILGNLDFVGAGAGSEILAMGSGTWNAYGNFDWRDGTITQENSTLVMNTDGMTIYPAPADRTINALTIKGDTSINYGLDVTGTLTIDTGKTLTTGTSVVGYINSSTINLNGSIVAGESQSIAFQNNGINAIPATGTITGAVIIHITDGSSHNLVARTFSSNLTFNYGSTSASAKVVVGSGTLQVGGNVDFSSSISRYVQVDAATNDPTVNITGDLTCSSTTINSSLEMGDGTWTIGGNINLTNFDTFTANSSTVTLNGTGAQTLTAASQSLYNLTVTNASASGVTFADSLTLTGTFTDVTPSSKLTFDALSTYAFANININGQATGTKITMVSNDPANVTPADRQWYFNVSQTSPQASYVNVTDSDANGGNAITPISSTDGGNNENWLFNISPTEDSLTFINPYGGVGNVAVSDNTTEWTFRALVSDEDGLSDIDYVLLRFANNSDSSSPFDALKYKWTQGSDAFSEEADALNAASITSTSDDSNGSGNQWTLDFKIKFNDDFASLDTNYSVELVVVDDGAATDSGSYSNIYQVKELSLILSVDYSTLDFSNLLPGSITTKTTVTTVTCNHPNGYSLAISDLIAGVYSALLHTDLSTRIADYGSGISSPTVWSGTGLGVTVYEATGKDTSKWGTGTTENDLNNKYAGIPETATIIHLKTGSPTANDQTKVGYKVVVPETQKTGYYSGTVTFTATGVLD